MALIIITIIAANAYMLVELLDRRATERAERKAIHHADRYRTQRAADLRRQLVASERMASEMAAMGLNVIAAYHRGVCETLATRIARLEA